MVSDGSGSQLQLVIAIHRLYCSVSYMPLSHRAWTTVMACTPGTVRLFSKDYNAI